MLASLLALASGGCGRVEARGLAREGNDLYRAGNFEQALSKFEAAARLEPGLPILQLHLGYAALSLATSSEGATARQHTDRAIRAFGRYIELAPDDERGPKFYLQALIDAGRLDQALRFLEAQHHRNPSDLAVVSSLGVVSSKAGDFRGALRWYEKRAAMLPEEAKGYYMIGTLCWEHLYKNGGVVGTERVKIADRGIVALKQAMKLQPSYAEAVTYVNLLYRERAKGQTDPAARDGDMQQAERYYRQAVELMQQRK